MNRTSSGHARPDAAGASPASPSASGLLLGADVGGSHTVIVAAQSDLRILGRAEGPGAAMRPGGGAKSAVIIGEAARRAVQAAGLSLPADAMVVGAAGAGRDPEQAELTAAIERAGVARRVRVLPDVAVALHAAFGRDPGILLNAGTGSVAFARDVEGKLHRAGGYGWQLGDEGGGYWIGRRALVAVGRALDGRGDAGTLPQRLPAALGLAAFDDVVAWANIATPAQVAELAPDVLNAARDGDPVARTILEDAARELTDLVCALERWFPGREPVPVAVSGGLLSPASPLLALLTQTLAGVNARAQLLERRVDSAAGAVELARDLL